MRSDGTLQELSNDVRERYLERIDQLADDQLRTMMMTYADLPGEQLHPNWDLDTNVEKDLILIGICGIRDPLRDEVPGAIEDCKRAGVMVRMVTGDNLNTAISILGNVVF